MPAERNIAYIDTPGDSVRVVQLTDTHLCAEAGGKLLGMDTDHSLQAVIDLVRRERDAVDLLLGTGDLADSGAAPAYLRLRDYFGQFPCPQYWLPGNHDQFEHMQQAAAGQAWLSRELRAGNWQIVLLDSQVPGEVGGELGDAELALLEAALADAAAAGLHSLVCLHHHPVEIGCAWLDQQIVADAARFFSVLDRFDGVRAVLWGHVHQEIDRLRGDVRLLASPSTCVQFAPGSDTFRADDLPPGYRWLDLHPDGRLDTGVSRVRDIKFSVDLDSGGYL
ncbi:MAG: 3',5'-cyclic-AMP phosphodiesterase [Halioglobus sp.]|nr:3',5'-cyclic-AMP phosphodiesterase [Halioglobus sp.]|tara:strand:+ start:499 stop:1335 length:837 start_codon:yes stop_codon:yes gene_type:complete